MEKTRRLLLKAAGAVGAAGVLSAARPDTGATQAPLQIPARAGTNPADLILTNGKIITVDPTFTIAQAIAIAGDRILAVGPDAAVAAMAGPATRVVDLKGKAVIPGITDGHAHMDREALRNVFPALGPVRSIRDIQDRIAELARAKRPGEWIVTMPIGDPPYYFDVPESLAEKRWPTRQELDVAAPENPVFIRSIWGYWRGTFPLVSCANTEALRRAGITRDTVSPVDTVKIEKDANGDPTGVFVEREMAPIAELIWFRHAAAFTPADRLRTLPQSARAYHAFGTTSVFEGHGASTELLRTYKQAHREGALTMRAALAFSPNWQAAGGAPLGPFMEAWAGWLGEPGFGNDWLKMSGLYVHAGREAADDVRARAAPYTGWAGFNSNHGLPRDQAKQLLLHCAANDIRAVMIGSSNLDLYDEVRPGNSAPGAALGDQPHQHDLVARYRTHRAHGARPHDAHQQLPLQRIACAGAASAAGAPWRNRTSALAPQCRREGLAGDRQCAGLTVPADLANGRAHKLPDQGTHRCR